KIMRQGELHPAQRTTRQPGQIRAGLRYVWNEPQLRATLIMMFIIGTFAYEFPVILPLFATVTLHGDASTYSAMTAAMGIGAICGGLYTAGRGAVGATQLVRAACLFGISLCLLALTPRLVAALVVLVVVGGLSVLFIALGNTTLQLTSQPEMRGRVMSLWSIAFLGTTPIGGPLIGFIADHSNPRVGLLVGGIATLIAGAVGVATGRHKKSAPTPKPA
ncbi:MAG TPA: MFS transporter, partial [Candidatus Saccharimonadales bacterium]